MQQLIQPNLTVQGKAGWCLSVAQDVWGVPHLYPKAIDAWNASSASNHTDPLPDVAVPVYWTFFDRTDGVEYGHIATYVPNRGIYSSPFNSSFGSEWYPSLQALTERVNQIAGANCRYLGWSETLSGVQLVTKEDEMVQDTDNEYGRWRKAFYQIRGRDANRQEFKNAAVGRTWLNALEILSDDPEADSSTNNQEVGKVAIQDNWQGQIYDLQARTAELGKSVTIKDDEIKKLTAQLAVQSGDTQLLNGFGAWLTKIIVRLGLKG